MKKLALIFTAALLLACCEKPPIEKPKNLKFENAVWEFSFDTQLDTFPNGDGGVISCLIIANADSTLTSYVPSEYSISGYWRQKNDSTIIVAYIRKLIGQSDFYNFWMYQTEMKYNIDSMIGVPVFFQYGGALIRNDDMTALTGKRFKNL
ncbi:MAG: hypothetical protein LBN95_12000 [Prevotellaceae bacterium]|jgi:hypothetical protein|nr:hypothetical protein [Prevotellaceae bacterium]